MKWFKSKAFVASVAMAIAGTAAGAAPVEISKQQNSVFGTNGSASVTITDTPLRPGGIGTRAGGFALKGGGLGDFVAWCLDITTYLKLASNYEVTEDSAGYAPFPNTTMLSQAQKSRVQSLFDTAFSMLDLTTATDSGGFQLALWEVVFEDSGSYNITSGDFTATGHQNAQNKANELLEGMGGPITQSYRLTFLESQDHHSQNLVTAAPIPLPAAGFLLLGALGGLAAAARRKNA